MSRRDLSDSGVHKPLQAGISGGEQEGCDSVVLSGGYEDDEDLGDVILYTGYGGRDLYSGEQIADHLLSRGNLALARSCIQGLPVRVVRGENHKSPYSPPVGYHYDGLYRVADYWREQGKSGHTIWRFRLEKIKLNIANVESVKTRTIFSESPEPYTVLRTQTTVQRIVRNSTHGRKIKELYAYACQICGIKLEGSSGPYTESAHIRPLGMPHNGSDSMDNILCLCPNHHVLFDFGGFAINDNLTLLGIYRLLNVDPRHSINLDNVRYHREHYYRQI